MCVWNYGNNANDGGGYQCSVHDVFPFVFGLFVVENHRLFSAKMGIKKSQKIGIFEINKKATIIGGLFSAFIY